MDHFLTALLQVVIVVDVAAAIAYFVLGGLKRSRRRQLEGGTIAPPQALRLPLWQRLLRRGPPVEPPTAGDLAQLQRILRAFEEGLA
ncbi:MAG: hypothetical protein AB1505_12380 [Candidatus Latescibacterota bacterium]